MNRWSAALYTTIAIAATLLALLPVSAGLRQRFLANHHLRPPSTASWIVIGLLPKMYGGRHELWMSDEPLTDFFRADPSRAPFRIIHEWVNHSPARAVRLDTARESAAASGATTHVRLESSYGAESLTTTYRVRVTDGRVEVRAGP